MSETCDNRKDAVEEAAGEFSSGMAKAVFRSTRDVMRAGTTNFCRRAWWGGRDCPTHIVDPAVTVKRLEDVWGPKVHRHICESIIEDPDFADTSGPAATRRACEIARREATSLVDLVQHDVSLPHAPYGFPFVRASKPVGEGGYPGWDRELLLDSHAMPPETCLFVSYVPYDDPGMRDGLIFLAVNWALETLRRPSEANELAATRAFAPGLASGKVPWDDGMRERVSAVRVRCEGTAAGRFALSLPDYMRTYNLLNVNVDGSIHLADCLWGAQTFFRGSLTQQAREDAMASTYGAGSLGGWSIDVARGFASSLSEHYCDLVSALVMQACVQARGSDDEAAWQEADGIMDLFPRISTRNAFAILGRCKPKAGQDPHGFLKPFADDQEEKALWMYNHSDGTSLRRLIDSFPRLPDPFYMPKEDQADMFGCFAAGEGFGSRLDPVLVVGFPMLCAGVTEPDAAYLIDLTDGWIRICRAAAILSCPEYGAVAPLDVDVAAGVLEIKRHYDAIVPTLSPVWRAAFERQWQIFAKEIAEIGRLYEEALRR